MERTESIGAAMSRAALFLIIAAMFIGCSSVTGPDTAGETPELAPGKVPGPTGEIEAITIVFSAVQVLREASGIEGWRTVTAGDLSEGERTFELLAVLDGLEAILGGATLEPGVYAGMRILVERAVITVNELDAPLKITGNSLRIDEPFEVGPSGSPLLPLDFDASEAVKGGARGKQPYKMDGLLHLAEVPPPPQTGTISGVVVPSIYALVSVYVSGSSDLVASVYTDPASDGFLLADLPPGTYDLEASAPGYQSGWETGIALAAGELSGGHVLVLTEIGGGEKR